MDKIKYMEEWCEKQGLELVLKGECGILRPCVGVLGGNTAYPDYYWFDEDFEEISGNGGVWTPRDAYHKHPCVCVLGHGEKSIEQLYEWLKWFDENGFEYQRGRQLCVDPIEKLMGREFYHRMVKVRS